MNLQNYFIKNNEVWRKTHFCEKSKRMKYEKKMRVKKSGKYEYILIDDEYHPNDYIITQLEEKSKNTQH